MLTPLIQLIQEDLVGMGTYDAGTSMRIGVALQEALSNSLYHGNLEVSSELRQEDERVYYALANSRRNIEPYRDRRLRVEVRLDQEQVTFLIKDDGPGFDTSTVDKPIDPEDLMRIGGRGMLLIRTFMDEVTFNQRGNQITMVKRGRPRVLTRG